MWLMCSSVRTTGSHCHGHNNCRLQQSTNDEATINKVTNVELDVMRLETQEVGNDKTMSLGSWEGHKRMKIVINIKETRWDETRILD